MRYLLNGIGTAIALSPKPWSCCLFVATSCPFLAISFESLPFQRFRSQPMPRCQCIHLAKLWLQSNSDFVCQSVTAQQTLLLSLMNVFNPIAVPLYHKLSSGYVIQHTLWLKCVPQSSQHLPRKLEPVLNDPGELFTFTLTSHSVQGYWPSDFGARITSKTECPKSTLMTCPQNNTIYLWSISWMTKLEQLPIL